MKMTLFASLVTVLAFALTASAGVIPIPKDNPVATVPFPEKWKVKVGEYSIDAVSDDDDVSIYITAHDGVTIDPAIGAASEYLTSHGVKIKKDSEIKTEAKVNGMDVLDYTWKGTDKDGDTRIGLTIYRVSTDRLLLVLFWASPSGEKDNAKELKAIYAGIKPTAAIVVPVP